MGYVRAQPGADLLDTTSANLAARHMKDRPRSRTGAGLDEDC